MTASGPLAPATPLDAEGGNLRDWQLAMSPPDAWATPADLWQASSSERAASLEWLPAIVPGTVAASLKALGRWSLDAPTPLHDRDVWYRCRIAAAGPCDLVLDGLATIAEVYLDGELILSSRNMFAAHRVPIDARPGAELAIAFRSLDRDLESVKPKRARWRTSLIDDARLRAVRTTLLGHMPGWCPPVDAVGPWRSIRLVPHVALGLRDVHLRSELFGPDGCLRASFALPAHLDATGARLICAGQSAPFSIGDDGRLFAELRLPGIERWWPHTHGTPTLHEVEAEIGGERFSLGRVGFREIALDRGADGDGFGLRINGIDIFARGAVWLPADIVSLASDRDTCRPVLERVRDAGLNMLRVPGIAVYEAADFHALCDELGILVWQDLMFANFDYPADDPDFVASVSSEVIGLLHRLSASPSLAVVCGGSEITQQAAMMGLPPANWGNALFDDHLPAIFECLRPDVVWVRSTPDGGELPFVADTGVTHYFGVGAYRRPLDDARRANVRFAAECLAFAHVPDDAALGAAAPASFADPLWKARVPRDTGADWDFEDVRQHYERVIFGADPDALAASDPQRALDVARAVTAHVIKATFAEWRRPQSPTRGALVLSLRDLWPGAGWGYLDASGLPKSSFHALSRASRPLALLLTDEGVNGLDLHVVNERPQAIAARLDLTCYAEGRRPVVSASRDIEVAAHGGVTIAATDLIGRFFDVTYAYRFGPPAHDLTHARLVDAAGETLAEAFHFPVGRTLATREGGLAVRVERAATGFELVVSCTAAALSVVIDDAAFAAADNGFHMVPGERRIALVRRPGAAADAMPQGHVRALNLQEIVSYSLSSQANH